ncbi:hypothetical protein H7K32_24760 [Brevibacillus agri]|nr:hypothetical protein [Brevibacillus agri]
MEWDSGKLIRKIALHNGPFSASILFMGSILQKLTLDFMKAVELLCHAVHTFCDSYNFVRIVQGNSIGERLRPLYNQGNNTNGGGYAMRKWMKMTVLFIGLLIDTKTMIRTSDLEMIVKL